MNNDVLPDFTLPRFYVANLIEGMRKRLQVSKCRNYALNCVVALSSNFEKFEPPRCVCPNVASLSSFLGRMCSGWTPPQKQRPSSKSTRSLLKLGAKIPLLMTGRSRRATRHEPVNCNPCQLLSSCGQTGHLLPELRGDSCAQSGALARAHRFGCEQGTLGHDG